MRFPRTRSWKIAKAVVLTSTPLFITPKISEQVEELRRRGVEVTILPLSRKIARKLSKPLPLACVDFGDAKQWRSGEADVTVLLDELLKRPM